jgi:hypothetical protein
VRITPGHVARLDKLIAELAEVRAELVAEDEEDGADEQDGQDDDPDFKPCHMLELSAARGAGLSCLTNSSPGSRTQLSRKATKSKD